MGRAHWLDGLDLAVSGGDVSSPFPGKGCMLQTARGVAADKIPNVVIALIGNLRVKSFYLICRISELPYLDLVSVKHGKHIELKVDERRYVAKSKAVSDSVA